MRINKKHKTTTIYYARIKKHISQELLRVVWTQQLHQSPCQELLFPRGTFFDIPMTSGLTVAIVQWVNAAWNAHPMFAMFDAVFDGFVIQKVNPRESGEKQETSQKGSHV